MSRSRLPSPEVPGPTLTVRADLGGDRAGGHALGVPLERAAPSEQPPVPGGRPEQRLGRQLEVLRIEDERARLRPPQSAVEADELLERAALVEHRVIEAADH